jgi:hypothetical protein
VGPLSIGLDSSLRYYVFVSVTFLLAFYAMKRIVDSPLGIIFQSIRENPGRAAAVGYDVKRYKWLAFTIAGAFTGGAGTLFRNDRECIRVHRETEEVDVRHAETRGAIGRKAFFLRPPKFLEGRLQEFFFFAELLLRLRGHSLLRGREGRWRRIVDGWCFVRHASRSVLLFFTADELPCRACAWRATMKAPWRGNHTTS